MCGIAGIFDYDGRPASLTDVQKMCQVLRHRGPDDEGYALIDMLGHHVKAFGGDDTTPDLHLPHIKTARWEDGSPYIGLGHRRLSIIDLSANGHQPMCDATGAYWIVFNGEIYNYLEIKAELQNKGYQFGSLSDTEVIINAYREWGAACLERFNGMWSFALYDGKRKELFLARDRLGQKPLYYRQSRGRFLFASEIKAITSVSNEKCEANERIIADFMVLGYADHSSATFFKDIHELGPASYAIIKTVDQKLTVRSYWHPPVDCSAVSRISEPEWIARTKDLLQDSVRLRLRSDVPLSVTLSGGLDSSSILCLMRRILGENGSISAYISKSNDPRYNEWPYAESAINHTRAEYQTFEPSFDSLMDEIRHYVWMYDEPIRELGGAAYGGWNLMRFISRDKKVCLEGQGADELMGGYPLSCGPVLLYNLLFSGRPLDSYKEMKGISDNYGISRTDLVKYSIGRPLTAVLPGILQKYLKLRQNGNELLSRSYLMKRIQKESFLKYSDTSRLQNRLWNLCTQANLPSYMHNTDRNSMAFSVESRMPFLDFRLVEHLMQMPYTLKIKNGQTKYILRKAMEGIVPENILQRKDKMGFFTPYDTWISRDLTTIVDTILKSEAVKPYINVRAIRGIRGADRVGLAQAALLWRIFSLAIWFEVFNVRQE